MTKINVGVQAMMLKGKFDELGAYDTLKKVHEIGYGSVEISQIPMNAANVDAMRRAQDDFGIKIAANLVKSTATWRTCRDSNPRPSA